MSGFTPLRVDITLCLLSSLTSGLVNELDLGHLLSSSGLSGPQGVRKHCPAVLAHRLQSPGTPNSHQHAYGAIRTANGDSSTRVFRLDLRNSDCLLGGRDDWLTPPTTLSKYSACGISVVSPRSGQWGPVCVSLQAHSRFARESVAALVPSTAGLAALGLLSGRRVCCLRSCSQASARQSVRSMLALSDSAFG